MPTPIAPSERYIDAEASRVYWLASVDDVMDVARSELDDAIDLTDEIAELTGWEVQSERRVNTPLGADFQTETTGVQSPGNTSMLLYADRAGDDIRRMLARHEDGVIAFLHAGDIPGHAMEVWPVVVASLSKPIQVGDEPALVLVEFVIPDQPQLNGTVPD